MIALPPAAPPLGFVIALWATIIGQSGKIRSEWLIVSRWGRGGSYLSIARTLIPVAPATNAPPHLVPRWSFLAHLQADNTAVSASFAFAEECPPPLRLAGRFTPAFGSARLDGSADSMRLRGELRCSPDQSGQRFQLEGIRVPWVGEFVEPRAKAPD